MHLEVAAYGLAQGCKKTLLTKAGKEAKTLELVLHGIFHLSKTKSNAGCPQGARLIRVRGWIELEPKSLQPADELIVDRDFAVFGHRGH